MNGNLDDRMALTLMCDKNRLIIWQEWDLWRVVQESMRGKPKSVTGDAND